MVQTCTSARHPRGDRWRSETSSRSSSRRRDVQQVVRQAARPQGRLARRSSARRSCVVIGPSGSGKTTFIRCINHLEKIQRRPDQRERPPHRLPRAADGKLVEDRETQHRAPAPGDRHGLPALQPVPAHDGARERHRGADPGPRHLNEDEARRSGRALLARVGPGAQDRRLSRAAVRRPAAARRDRPRAGHAAGADALRRADQRARPGDDRRGPRGHEGARPRGHDDDRRQPRDGLRAARSPTAS